MLTPEDAVYTIAGLVTYQILRATAKRTTKLLAPSFYSTLKQSDPSKFKAYFVFPVGFFLTVATTPVCISAFSSTDPDIDRSGSGSTRSLSVQERICLGSRGVLWISELPLLSYSTDYVVHHVLSLASLGLVVYKQLPLRPLYLIYAGLVTELCSDTTALLRFHGLDHKSSRVYAFAGLANALAMIILRAVPAIVFTAPYMVPYSTVQERCYMAGILFYCGWLMRLSLKQLSALGQVEVMWSKPPRLRLGGWFDVSIFSLLLGVSMALFQVMTAVLYSSTQDAALSENEMEGMAITSAGAAVTGLAGAYIWNWWVMSASPRTIEHTGNANGSARCKSDANGSLENSVGVTTRNYNYFLDKSSDKKDDGCTSPVQTSRFIKGISIQGAMLSSVAWVMLNPFLPASVDKHRLIACMAVGLPLGEALGRIGCYIAGCCGSECQSNDKGSKPVVPLMAAGSNGVVFVILVVLIQAEVWDIYRAGIIGAMSNASIRLAMNLLRGDSRGHAMAVMNGFAYCQVAASGALLILRRIQSRSGLLLSFAEAALFAVLLLLWARLFVNFWLAVLPLVMGTFNSLVVRAPWLRRPVIYVFGFSAYVFATVFFSDSENVAGGERAQLPDSGYGSPFGVVGHQVFLASICVTAISPVLLLKI